MSPAQQYPASALSDQTVCSERKPPVLETLRHACEIADHADFDLAGFEIGEDPVDLFEFRQVDIDANFTASREGDRLREIFAGADDRTANCQPLQHHLEDRYLKTAWWQADERHRPPWAQHFDRLGERRHRNGGYQHAVRAAFRHLVHLCDRIR